MLLLIWADEKYNTHKNPCSFVTQKNHCVFHRSQKFLLDKIQTQKNPSDSAVSKICEWGPWDLFNQIITFLQCCICFYRHEVTDHNPKLQEYSNDEGRPVMFGYCYSRNNCGLVFSTESIRNRFVSLLVMIVISIYIFFYFQPTNLVLHFLINW